MSALIEAKQISKWVGAGDRRLMILQDISFTLQAGQFVAIMGASGSGKSTLLNLLGLLDEPSAGSLRILGHDPAALPDDQRAQLRAHAIGFIFQSFNLLSYLTARQNIELAMTYGRRDSPEERSRRLLEQVRLPERADAYPTTLSGGERQRVAIARALANQPPLLLADEPTGSLDSRNGAQIMELISSLNRQGTSIVIVTHDEAVARRASQVLIMKDGRFTQS